MLVCLLSGSGGGYYREGLILNVTLIVVRFWWRVIMRGTYTECYCVCCEVLEEGILERN
jgi:hypothetical protein